MLLLLRYPKPYLASVTHSVSRCKDTASPAHAEISDNNTLFSLRPVR